MLNYKKSWISVAATLALASSVVSAGYLPLTKEGVDAANTLDKSWIMFGVSGFHGELSEGVSSPGEWGIDDSTRNTAIDTNAADGLYGSDGVGNHENGMYVGGAVYQLLGKVAIVPGTNAPDQVSVRVNTTNIDYSETDPERTIYVADEDGNVLFAFTYRAALEGKTLHYSTSVVGSETPMVREITINSQNSYSNPAIGTLTQPSGEVVEGANLKSIADTLDFDFSDNPVDSTYYKSADHQQQADDAGFAAEPFATFYSYDAQAAQWNLFDTRNTSNDFSDFQKGKGYWGKIDTTTSNNLESGLVLARDSISDEEYLAAGMTEGWNLLSFDAESPNIRVASTGLTGVPIADDITIYDAAGIFSTDAITLTAVVADAVTAINEAIYQAKEDGKLPRTFDIVAVDDGTNVILLSNEKFIVGGPGLGVPTTLFAAAAVDAQLATSLADIADGGTYDDYYQSKYGEYALVVEDLSADNADAKLEVGAVDGTAALEKKDVASNLSDLPVGYADYQLATIDGKSSLSLIVLDKPFFVKDHTFTRVFDFRTTDEDRGVVLEQISTGTETATIASGGNTAIADFVTQLNTGFTNAYADVTSDGKVAISTTQVDSAAFYAIETDGDVLTPVTSLSTAVEAQGAVANVYSINKLVKFSNLTAQRETVITTATGTNSTAIGDTVTFSLTGIDDIVHTVAAVYDLTTALGAQGFLEEIQDTLEGVLGTGTVTLAAGAGYDDWTDTTITITHPDVKAITAVTYDTAGTGTFTVAAIPATTIASIDYAIGNGDLTNDLKYNAVYTPNYVLNGPLYTLKDLGYTPRGIISGITNIDDTTRVKWDSIDLTRDPVEWLSSQEYDLFAVDYMGGYWVYLENDTTPQPLSVVNPQIDTANYTQHFDDPVTVSGQLVSTSYNYFSGNFSVEIPELEDYDKTAVRVQAKVANADIELAYDAIGNSFNGAIYASELGGALTSTSDVTLQVADGLGYRTTYPEVTGDLGVPVDAQKPAMPSVSFIDGANLAISSTSEDVAKFFVYKAAKVPAALSAAPAMNLTPAEAATTNVCASMDYGTSTPLTIFAIDGAGTRVGGNTSDAITIASYTPMLKEVMLLENANEGTASITSVGVEYDATCTAGEVALTNAGMQLSARTDTTQAKLAFQPIANVAITASPISVHLKDANNEVVRIDFENEYVGETVYVRIGAKVYSYQLPAASIPESSAVVPGAVVGTHIIEIVGQTL